MGRDEPNDTEADNEVVRHLIRKRASISVEHRDDPFEDRATVFWCEGQRFCIGSLYRRPMLYARRDHWSRRIYVSAEPHLIDTLRCVIEEASRQQDRNNKAGLRRSVIGASP